MDSSLSSLADALNAIARSDRVAKAAIDTANAAHAAASNATTAAKNAAVAATNATNTANAIAVMAGGSPMSLNQNSVATSDSHSELQQKYQIFKYYTALIKEFIVLK